MGFTELTFHLEREDDMRQTQPKRKEEIGWCPPMASSNGQCEDYSLVVKLKQGQAGKIIDFREMNDSRHADSITAQRQIGFVSVG